MAATEEVQTVVNLVADYFLHFTEEPSAHYLIRRARTLDQVYTTQHFLPQRQTLRPIQSVTSTNEIRSPPHQRRIDNLVSTQRARQSVY